MSNDEAPLHQHRQLGMPLIDGNLTGLVAAVGQEKRNSLDMFLVVFQTLQVGHKSILSSLKRHTRYYSFFYFDPSRLSKNMAHCSTGGIDENMPTTWL